MNASEDSGGDYNCTLSYSVNNITDEKSQNIRIYYVNETVHIREFSLNTIISKGCNNTLSCDFYSSTYNYIITFIKDGKEFFEFNNRSKNWFDAVT